MKKINIKNTMLIDDFSSQLKENAERKGTIEEVNKEISYFKERNELDYLYYISEFCNALKEIGIIYFVTYHDKESQILKTLDLDNMFELNIVNEYEKYAHKTKNMFYFHISNYDYQMCVSILKSIIDIEEYDDDSSIKSFGENHKYSLILVQDCYLGKLSKIHSTYPNAYFEKDNDIKPGSKGDYIFREFDEDGNEIISIMFEMKNENDTTATKHKNEHFFKELDKDRNEKKCEYAVLVSLLEADSDYYNSGIVDVSFRYPKMFVVRPQCFLAIISLLKNAAMNAAEYKKELALIRNQDVDVTNFENKLLEFQEKFGNNYRLANEKFNGAIEEIDKTITHLQKVKENLISTDRNLRLANDKLQDLSVKKLTYGNETMKEKFKTLETNKK